MAGCPRSTLPQALGTWAEAKAAYRFISNPKISHDKILEPHRKATCKRISEQPVVLAVQDTTDLNFTDHPATTGLGTIGSGESLRGMHVHTTMAFTPQKVPLGVLDQNTWERPPDEFGKRHTRNERSIDDKESYKWIRSFEVTESVKKQNPDVTLINVGDREADIYDLFRLASESESDLIVRASWDRRVEHEENYLWAHLEARPVAATVVLEVPVRESKKLRAANMELRFAEVTVRPPQKRASEKLSSIELCAVFFDEPDPPEGVDPVSWMLLTTLFVGSHEDAHRVVEYYSVRWSIEVFHRILKSGCLVEKRQLQTADRLRACLALDSLVAWRIQQLTMLGRDMPDLPCDVVFEEHEWKALHCYVHRTTKPPRKPPSVYDVMMMVARVGGFLARKSDMYPGPTALWRGLQQLPTICWSWFAFGPGSIRG